MPAIRTPWGTLTPTEGSATGHAVPPPVSVPDHTLLRRIGRGAYGEVWLARNALGLYRAVKVLHRSSFGDDRPFEREFAGIQRFEPISRSHESQLNILHVGRTPEHFYYVMELADDQGHGPVIDEATYTPRTLRSELLFRGRLPVDECIRLGLALGTALEHLHRHGLVHRDIKPSNIVFVNGIPKLADIGLVAQAERTMSFVGTEGYLPPEGPGTAQADIFSLGKVLYEISTGNDRQQFPELPTHVTELPDRAALSEFNEVLVRACAPDVKERYQTAAEMHADLALLQSGGSVQQQRRLAGRLRFVQRAGAFVTALAAVVALGWWWQARQTRVVRSLIDEKSALAEENRHRVVRLNVANGIRQLDAGDTGGALLWFAETLPLVTNNHATESIHRIRIEQTIRRLPRLHQLFTHDGEATSVTFGEDGRHIAVGVSSGHVQVWDSLSGQQVSPPLDLGLGYVQQVRLYNEGKALFAASASESRSGERGGASVAVGTGRPLFSLAATNLVQISMTPDDRWLVVADASGAIRLHDANDGRELGNIVGLTHRPIQLEVRREGNLIAASAEDFPARFQSVRVWRLPAGEPVGSPLRCARGPIALSADGRFLAAAAPAADGGNDTIVQVWDLESKPSSPSTTRLPGALKAMGSAPPARPGFWVLTEQRCAMLDPLLGREWGFPVTPPGDVTAVAVSRDGRMVAFGGKQGFAGVWSFDRGEKLLPPLIQEAATVGIEFSPEGHRVAVASSNGTVLILGTHLLQEDAQLRFDAPLAMDPLPNLDPRAFAPGRERMLVTLDDGSVRLVDFAQASERLIPSRLDNRSRAMQAVFDASGHRHAVSYGQVMELWTETGQTTNHFILSTPHGSTEDIGFTSGGNQLVAVCTDEHVRLWNTVDGSLQQEIRLPENGGALLNAGAGWVLARGPNNGPFQVIQLREPKAGSARLLPPGLARLAFSPAGDRFANIGPGNWSRVWRAETFEPVAPALEHGAPVLWVDWSPDNRHLLTAGLSAEVRIWDAVTGEPRQAPLSLGAEPLRTATWSLDGRLIAAGSDDRTARVWDATTGDPVTPLLRHEQRTKMVQLVAGGRLATLSGPDRLRTWDLRPSELPASVIADLARLFSGRRLTPGGATQRLTAAELSRLFGVLRGVCPERFTTPNHELTQWHRREVGLTLNLSELDIALFHLDRLVALAPDDPDLKRLRAQYEARRIPPRAPEVPANLLDLSAYYTSSLDTTMYAELADLPRGLRNLAGTLWDLRGFVSVAQGQAANHIPVGLRCRQLHFLQSTGGFFTRDGHEVAHWLVRYADGSAVEWPLIYGDQLRDWWWNYGYPREANQAVIAWEGHPNVLANGVRLFKSTWTNPRPEVEIQELSLVGGDVNASTSVFAITAD